MGGVKPSPLASRFILSFSMWYSYSLFFLVTNILVVDVDVAETLTIIKDRKHNINTNTTTTTQQPLLSIVVCLLLLLLLYTSSTIYLCSLGLLNMSLSLPLKPMKTAAVFNVEKYFFRIWIS